ncbi:MAG TPA: isocitrate lyase/phosphoenolpyruvate mutase family protein [Gaiellaceae bacterium]|nr:isocitrate lyase/phosphoenolpyruvate mutase family protein [Gaiellaceae bacterium]
MRPGDPLLLPNAWDAASARAVVAAGFPVVATTSAGVAATLGYEDHQGAPAGEMFAAAARITRRRRARDSRRRGRLRPGTGRSGGREAGADCVYPIGLWETDALRHFISEDRGPVNVMRLPQLPPLAELGVARVSWAAFLFRDAMAHVESELASLRDG